MAEGWSPCLDIGTLATQLHNAPSDSPVRVSSPYPPSPPYRRWLEAPPPFPEYPADRPGEAGKCCLEEVANPASLRGMNSAHLHFVQSTLQLPVLARELPRTAEISLLQDTDGSW